MLIQMPIWIALYNVVPNAIELRGESFLWADDLSAYDDVIRWGQDIWLIGDHLSIFCLLFCATNIINTWISMKQQKDQMSGEQAQQMKAMQYMMLIMPVVFFFMFNNYSSGCASFHRFRLKVKHLLTPSPPRGSLVSRKEKAENDGAIRSIRFGLSRWFDSITFHNDERRIVL